MAGALQEYLDDPNFEQNRVEYKANKEAADGVPKSAVNGKKSNAGKYNSSDVFHSLYRRLIFYDLASSISPKLPSLPTLPEVPTASTSQKVTTSSQQQGSKDIIDFFSAIEEEHPTALNPQNSKYDTRLPLSKITNSHLSTGYVQPGPNPFARMANGQSYQQPQIASQHTGFIVPQQTAVPQPNAFGNFQPQHRPFSSYLVSQPTGFQQLQSQQTSGFLQSPQQTFLQPQPTGSNPFRQSMLVPQSTGMALFGSVQGQSTPNGQSSQNAPASLPGVSAFSSPFSTMPLPAPTLSMGASSNNTPARPSSTPLTSHKTPSQSLQPVKSHQTGTKNPFGPITITPPPVPKAPTLLELTTGIAANGNTSQSQQLAEQPLPQQQTGALNKFSFNNSALNPGASDISSVASSFTFNPNTVGSTISDKSSSNNSGFMGSQQTGTTAASSAFSDSRLPPSNTSPTMSGPPPVTSHATGYGSLKPFIPSSSFGASLMESLPFPSSSPTNSTTGNNAVNGLGTSPGGANQLSSSSSNGTGNYSFLNNQPTGATGGFGGASSTYKSSLGVGLRPQMTGGGAVNPFRASSVGGPNFGAPTSFQSSQPLGANFFGINGGAFGTQGQQPQPYGTTSWFGHVLYNLPGILFFCS